MAVVQVPASDFNPMIAEISDGIGLLTFCRPQQKNAAGRLFWKRLSAQIAEYDQNPAIHVIVLTGGPTGPFCAGADIMEFTEVFATEEAVEDYLDVMESAIASLEQSPKPVIAAIEGVCIGAGVAIASACDVRVCAQDTKFGVTPANLGIMYSGNDVERLIRLVGEANAKFFLMTGKLVDTPKADQMGLVSVSVEQGQAHEEALKLAQHMVSRSQTTLQFVKAVIRDISGNSDFKTPARQYFKEAVFGDDFKEGVRAFSEKRKPEFPSSRT